MTIVTQLTITDKVRNLNHDIYNQPAHLVPCWLVGWWLWCAGCISQDAYLLYLIICFQMNCNGRVDRWEYERSWSNKSIFVLLARLGQFLVSWIYWFILFHMTRHKHNLITLLHLQSLKSSFRLNSLGKFFCGFHFYPYFWPVGQVWMYHDKWWIWKFPPSDRIFYSPPPQAIWT